MKWFRSLFILISLVLMMPMVAFSSEGTGDSAVGCDSLFNRPAELWMNSLGMDWTHLDRYEAFSYSPFQRLLFLSDGNKNVRIRANWNDEQVVVATDARSGPGIDRVVDNNDLPFADGEFDYVGMNRGLCTCGNPDQVCGGVSTSVSCMRSFLEGVIRVLDIENPESMALLTGYSFRGGSGVAERWESVISSLVSKYPYLQFTVIRDGATSGSETFVGLVITVKGHNLDVPSRLIRLISDLLLTGSGRLVA